MWRGDAVVKAQSLADAPAGDTERPVLPPPDFSAITQQFGTTASERCAYLPGLTERKLLTPLKEGDQATFEALNLTGFRRSHQMAYRPACTGCDLCKAVRIRCADFAPGRTQRRIARANGDLQVSMAKAKATTEHYDLFERYIVTRHTGGEMAQMSWHEFDQMLRDSPVATSVIEWREPADDPTSDFPPDTPGRGRLVAACLIDALSDGLSMVYSYFDPFAGQVRAERTSPGSSGAATKDNSGPAGRKSLGQYMILDLVRVCAEHDLPYLYLGYWVDGAKTMDYKRNYRPLEVFDRGAWREMAEDATGD